MVYLNTRAVVAVGHAVVWVRFAQGMSSRQPVAAFTSHPQDCWDQIIHSTRLRRPGLVLDLVILGVQHYRDIVGINMHKPSLQWRFLKVNSPQ